MLLTCGFVMSYTDMFAVDITGDDVAVVSRIAETLQTLFCIHGESDIFDVIDHNGIEPVALFQRTYPVKGSSAHFCAHVEGIFKSDAPVVLGVIEYLQFGKLNSAGDLPGDSCVMTAAYIAAQRQSEILFIESCGRHDAGDHIVGGIGAVDAETVVCLQNADIFLGGENHMGKNGRTVIHQTGTRIDFSIGAVAGVQTQGPRCFPAGFHQMGLQTALITLCQYTLPLQQLFGTGGGETGCQDGFDFFASLVCLEETLGFPQGLFWGFAKIVG